MIKDRAYLLIMVYRTATFSMTHNSAFKVTPLFYANYLRNGTKFGHNYNKALLMIISSISANMIELLI